jgi:DNA-binding MarR family transcriptional regulator
VIAAELNIYRETALAAPLFTLIEDFDNRVMTVLREQDFTDLLRSHGSVFRYLSVEGAYLSELALRAGITKQSLGRIARDLEQKKYITINSLPGDARLRRVLLSKRGKALITAAKPAIDGARQFYSAIIGADRFERFCANLRIVMERLAVDFSFADQETDSLRWRFGHFGRLLAELAENYAQRFMRHLDAERCSGVSRPMLKLLFHIDPAGSSFTSLAGNMPVSVQAVSLTLREMVRSGLLDEANHPSDGRAKVLKVSASGLDVLRIVNRAANALRGEYQQQLGVRRLNSMEADLRDIVAGINSQRDKIG